MLIVLAAGVIACLAVTGRNAVVRGATYGAVAGAYFGTLGVMVDAASTAVLRATAGTAVAHRAAAWCR